eukprot:s7532_g1.t1
MRCALASQLRSTGDRLQTAGRPTSPRRLQPTREARIRNQQSERLRHADVGSCRDQDSSRSLICDSCCTEKVTAMDLTSALEIRLHEAERRITVLLRNVKFVEEFRHLCRKERECEWETMGSIVVQPPSTPRPASTRPGCAAVAREAAPPAAQVEALEARVAKLEALDFEGRKEVSAVKNTAEALDFRVATLEAMDISLKAPETEKLLDPGSLANVTQLAEQALQEVSKVSELSTRLTERQAAMESQSEDCCPVLQYMRYGK